MPINEGTVMIPLREYERLRADARSSKNSRGTVTIKQVLPWGVCVSYSGYDDALLDLERRNDIGRKAVLILDKMGYRYDYHFGAWEAPPQPTGFFSRLFKGGR